MFSKDDRIKRFVACILTLTFIRPLFLCTPWTISEIVGLAVRISNVGTWERSAIGFRPRLLYIRDRISGALWIWSCVEPQNHAERFGIEPKFLGRPTFIPSVKQRTQFRFSELIMFKFRKKIKIEHKIVSRVCYKIRINVFKIWFPVEVCSFTWRLSIRSSETDCVASRCGFVLKSFTNCKLPDPTDNFMRSYCTFPNDVLPP